MKRRLLALILLLLLLAGIARAEGEITSKAMLNQQGCRIGIPISSAADTSVEEEFPEATVVRYNDNLLGFTDVALGRLDAYIYEEIELKINIENGVTGVRVLDEVMNRALSICVGISPVSEIPNLEAEVNQFIAEMHENGTIEDMLRRWVWDAERTLPEIELPEHPQYHLVVGTTGVVMPFSYYEGTELTGFDIELAHRFAAWLNADIRFEVYDYGSIVPAAVTGKVDVIMACLQYTDERADAGLIFSDELYPSRIGILVRDDGERSTGGASTAGNVRWQDYNGKRLGVLIGPLMEDAAAEYFPDSEYLIFNSYPDCIAALKAGKIDAYLGDEPSMKALHAEQPDIDYIHDRITQNNYSFAFRKNDPDSAALCAELNDFLARSWADGTMQELDDIWFGTDEDRKVVDMSGLTGANGTIRVVTTSTDAPFSYIKDGKNVGYDIDLVVRFCREGGYALELGDVDFAGRIPAIESGKYDFTTDMNVAPERQEQVLFSDPTSYGGIVLAVRSSDIADASQSEAVADFAAMSGKTVAVQTGTISGEVAMSVIPDIQVEYFNSQTDCLAALRAGKVDAWCSDEPVVRFLMIDNRDLIMYGDKLDESSIAAVFAKTDEGQALCDQYSAFVDGLWADGTMAEIDAVWFGTDGDKCAVLDYEALPDTNGTLRMAVDTSMIPFAMVKDNRVVGYDVDIAARFCESNGYGLEVVPMSFDGILPSVQTGKCDFAACCITVTKERAESVLFSSPNYHSGTVIVLNRKDRVEPAQAGGYTSLSQLNGARIGVATGTTFDDIVRTALPDAQITYINSSADLIAALEAGKIDGFAVDEPAAKQFCAENPRLAVLDEYLDSFEFGFVLPKTGDGEALLAELNTWLISMKESGALTQVIEKWANGPEASKTLPDYAAFPAPKGTLTLATEGDYVPMNYYRGNEIVGAEIDLAAQFCEANGYGLEVKVMNFDGLLPAVQTGKVDFAAAGISITDERRDSVSFSVPYYAGGTVMVVLKAEEPAAIAAPSEEAKDTFFWGGIKSSFHKTFIREGRWRLFSDGVLTTLLITLLSILFGTLMGFALFMLCRNGNPVTNLVTRFCLWLVQGMPMVVLLMILYYIIFGSVAISGVTVAVIGFTLTFGAAVYGLLKMGVGAVDNGQYEAACALGYTNIRTFFRIILPQALPHVLPAYRGEIVGLIKATAIVGYIAVQDLTKMGDIVRSRTYEAFFPLIAITVIYFVLEGLLGFLVSRISVNFNPKRRKPADILKGVKTDD